MCLIIDRNLTEEFSNKYTTNTKLTYYKLFDVCRDETTNEKYLETPFQNIKIDKNSEFIEADITDLDIRDSVITAYWRAVKPENARVILGGCLHCFQDKKTGTEMQRAFFGETIVIPIEVWSDDVISIGEFDEFIGNFVVVSKYKIPKSFWDTF